MDLIKKEVNFNRIRITTSNIAQRKKSNNRGSVESRGPHRDSIESRQRSSIESRKSKLKKK